MTYLMLVHHEPAQLAGLLRAVVRDGDLVVGDGDGVVVIPHERAAEVVARGSARLRDEEEQFAQIAEGTLDRAWVLNSLTETIVADDDAQLLPAGGCGFEQQGQQPSADGPGGGGDDDHGSSRSVVIGLTPPACGPAPRCHNGNFSIRSLPETE